MKPALSLTLLAALLSGSPAAALSQAASTRPATSPPAASERQGPVYALRPQLETVLTIQLLAGLTANDQISWTAVQRKQLRDLLQPLQQPGVPAGIWATLSEELPAVLSPGQRSALEQARARVNALAARRLSASRLALLDGPGFSQLKWRYAFSIQGGPGLVRQLEENPAYNLYQHAPYSEHLAVLLNR
ncbi:hypothetical protein [Deinococcus sp. Marseille-Q6407]|uniref:hypothetical protein n=1 Tax=Deinococcus sp. Marseille-Q6407 TaxID=2969223 RepID=UPI0021C130DE|nr:hypothetical protein [Deinococcus sp. Marseille-Q6407]